MSQAEILRDNRPTGSDIKVRPFFPNRQASIRLAKARAEAIRTALIAEGVAGAGIRVSLDSANQTLVAEVAVQLDHSVRLSESGSQK